MPAAQATPALSQLLADLFDQDELVRFLHQFEGHELISNLPRNVSNAQFAFTAAEKLSQRGLISQKFFEQLSLQRPHRVREIQDLMRLLGVSTRTRIQIVLNGSLENLSEKDFELLLLAVKDITRDSTVEIKGKRAGSVIVELELNAESARLMVELHRTGHLRELLGMRVLEIKIEATIPDVKDASMPSVSSAVRNVQSSSRNAPASSPGANVNTTTSKEAQRIQDQAPSDIPAGPNGDTSTELPTMNLQGKIDFIKFASKVEPSVKVAIGVGGIAAVISIILTGLGLSATTAVFGFAIMVGAMILLVIFNALAANKRPDLRPLAVAMAWAFLVLSMGSVTLLTSCFFFDYPKTIACLFGSENCPRRGMGNFLSTTNPMSSSHTHEAESAEPTSVRRCVVKLAKLITHIAPVNRDAFRCAIDNIARNADPGLSIEYPPELELLVSRIEQDPLANEDSRNASLEWRKEAESIRSNAERLLIAYARKRKLAGSDVAISISDREHAQIAKEGVAVLTGTNVSLSLEAQMDGPSDNKEEIDALTAEAVDKFLAASLTLHIPRILQFPQAYLNGADQAFILYLGSLQETRSKFETLINRVGYSGDYSEEDFRRFECGAPPEESGGEYRSARFFVPLREVRQWTQEGMWKDNPWPASRNFSERWWLQNALWQMLTWRTGERRSHLGLTPQDYPHCGPP